MKKDKLFFDSSTQSAVNILKPFQRKLRLIGLTGLSGGMESELSLIGTYFLELLKAFFLVEVLALFWIAKELESKQASIIKLFDYVGRLDTSISIASLRADNFKTCQPSFGTATKEMSIKNMYHPLIENCVKNDLIINGKSVMITGSNMSGKSTFLRSLAINSILAQTIFTCFADEFHSPILKQFSSIRIDDSLLNSKSYYLQEVSVMGSLITQSESADQNLFVLDEVFKGTNTVERIATAKAVLTYLNKGNNIVIIATHDIELSEMLIADYDLYHFSELIEYNQLYFDYKLKAGQLKTRNAIKILELANYPKEIIEEAKSISEGLT